MPKIQNSKEKKLVDLCQWTKNEQYIEMWAKYSGKKNRSKSEINLVQRAIRHFAQSGIEKYTKNVEHHEIPLNQLIDFIPQK